MRITKKDFFQQYGSGMMETLLAIAVVGAIMPFAYNSAIDISRKISDSTEATRVSAWQDPIMAWVRKNQSEWPSVSQIEFDEEKLKTISSGDNRFLLPYAGFIDKRTGRSGAMINAYLAFRPIEINEMRVANIAKNLGADAAIVNESKEAVSSAGWSVSSQLFTQGDLVFRISDVLGEDDSNKYLHRTYLDNTEMNTMLRDMNMAKHNIFEIGKISAETLNATNGNVWFSETPMIKSTDAYFPEGATVDASKASFGSINVNGDVSGMRKITVGKLMGGGGVSGAGWSLRGDVVVDSVNINGSIHVENDMVVRAESSRTITGFSGVRADSVAAPYLYADEMIFGNSFGITISSDLMYSSAGVPIKLGTWNFPTSLSPKFSSLSIGNLSGKEIGESLLVPNSEDFGPIMTSGWKDR